MDGLTKKIVIEYDPMNNAISIPENDFSAFEAFGMLEAAKAMISDRWIKETD